VSRPDEPFVARWSRRKLADDAPDAAESVPETADAEETPAAPPPDLPDIETLDKDSDYTAFMRDGVPEELKKLALRALWRSDPVLANLDGLNDYDEDYGSILETGAAFMRKLASEQQDEKAEEGDSIGMAQDDGEVDGEADGEKAKEESVAEPELDDATDDNEPPESA